MKIALVTTPWSSRSGIADYTRHLLPYLRAGAQVDLFVEVGREGEACGEEELRSVADLIPKDYDQILYQLGNEGQHAFMVPMVRSLGGTVMMHDWVLFDLCMAAHPILERGGLRGARRAFEEGGLEQAGIWWKARRSVAPVHGWFDAEAQGRWSSAQAPMPGGMREGLRLSLHVPEGRSWSVVQGEQVLQGSSETGDVQCEIELESTNLAAPVLQVRGAAPSRRDPRALGVFLRNLEERVDGTWRALDLDELPSVSQRGLCESRFELPLNHSIVRHGDAFLVHSDVVGERILESRNSMTPIRRVHHGAQPRWTDTPREGARGSLGLDESWRSSFVLATLGALQRHKRPDVLLRALSDLRAQGADVRLLCIGEERPAEFDLRGALQQHGLQGAVHVTGYLPEDQAWQALHAADLCVNLRGPSTGGTSGGACQALAMGRAVLVSDLPELSHLPGDCVLRVPVGDGEHEHLVRTIADLCAEPGQLARLELAAREVVSGELHWKSVAEHYLAALANFPRARASRRSMFVRFLHATAREKQKDAKKDAEPEAGNVRS